MAAFPRLLMAFFLASVAIVQSQDNFESLAIDFHIDETAEVLNYEADTYFCIKLTLRPEDDNKGKYDVHSEVENPWHLPTAFEGFHGDHSHWAKQQKACNAKGGVYASASAVHEFANNAISKISRLSTAHESSHCHPDVARVSSPSCKNVKRGSPLENAIADWNDRWFNMNSPEFRQHTELFHGVGSEQDHLAYEVTLFTAPEDLQARLKKRYNWG